MKFIFVFIFILFSISSKAVPAYHGLFTKTQPDGTTLNVYLRGDENFSFNMTEDGYLITPNSDGIFEYAELKDDMTIVPLGIKVTNILDRTIKEKMFVNNLSKVSEMKSQFDKVVETISIQKRQQSMQRVSKYPTKGSPKSLVILVNFQDVEFTYTRENFESLLNQKNYALNGATGSVKDYFEASSFNQFSPEFVVVGPYTLPQKMKYYGKNNYSAGVWNENVDQMIIDACELADVEINFSEYDLDVNGYIDNIFVYYAGYNEAEGASENAIWSCRSAIVSTHEFDGVKLYDYACTSELRGRKGTTMCGIGTFCHEFGHVLGLPDFYCTDYSHNEPTLRAWDVMDQGSYNNEGKTPPSFSSYERFFCGWLTPEPIDSVLGIHHLEPLITSNKAYIFSSTSHNLDGYDPNPKEFFMLENRQRIGWDSIGLPGEGLLVTHVDYNATRWINNTPNNDADDMSVQIVCAAEDTNSPEYNTYPGKANVTSCLIRMKDNNALPNFLTNIVEDLNSKVLSFIYENSDYYTIITQVNNSEMGEIRGNHKYYLPNETVTLEAVPNDGYKFVKWNDGSTENPRSFIALENDTIIAEFTTATYKVDISCDEEYGIVTGEGEYEFGTFVTITAIANECSKFYYWIHNGYYFSDENPCTFKIGAKDYNIEAIFEKIPILIDGIYYYLYKENNYAIVARSENYNGNIIIPTQVTYKGVNYSVTNIEEKAFESTKITMIEIPNSVVYIGDYAFSNCTSLTSVIIGNSVTSIGKKAFEGCSSISSITIQAKTQPIIKDDTFNEVPRGIEIKVPCGSINSYKTAEYWEEFINYVENIFILTVVSNDNSMGFATVTKRNSCDDPVAQVQAQALADYRFVRWSDGSTENPHIVLVTEDMTLTAEFAINQCQVTLESDGNGSVTGSGTYEYGTEIIIEAKADKGYHFEKWSDGNTENPRSITVTEDMTLTAEFAINQYQVILESDGNGSVTGAGTYDYGTEVTIEAIADKGYHFEKWSDDNTENPRTITVTEDIELSATFELDETPVDNITNSYVVIYTNGNILHIEGAETDYYVLDAAGRLIYSGRDTELQLPRGVYVVNVGGEVQKVVI